jgi:hypothetical protein
VVFNVIPFILTLSVILLFLDGLGFGARYPMGVAAGFLGADTGYGQKALRRSMLAGRTGRLVLSADDLFKLVAALRTFVFVDWHCRYFCYQTKRQ